MGRTALRKPAEPKAPKAPSGENGQAEDEPADNRSEFERFRDLTRKLVNTPKPKRGE
jgi:hypothetical protein